jgi:hypothetical protein
MIMPSANSYQRSALSEKLSAISGQRVGVLVVQLAASNQSLKSNNENN